MLFLWGLARSPPPPALPLNGAAQLCTLQWEGGGPKAAAPQRRGERSASLLLLLLSCLPMCVVRSKRQRPVPTPVQPTCTTRPPKRREGRGGRRTRERERDEISWNSALGDGCGAGIPDAQTIIEATLSASSPPSGWASAFVSSLFLARKERIWRLLCFAGQWSIVPIVRMHLVLVTLITVV